MDTNQAEADSAECAAAFLKLGGNASEQFVMRILKRATVYVASQLNSIIAGGDTVNSDTVTIPTSANLSFEIPSPSTVSSPAYASPVGSIYTLGSRKSSISVRGSNQSQGVPIFNDTDEVEEEAATMTYNMTGDNTVLDVYCEGTSVNIGTQNARSGCGVYAKYIKEDLSVRELKKCFALSAGEPASNQRAELRAFYSALDIVQKIKDANPLIQTFRVHITSKYALNCATEWGRQWAANRWKRPEGPIKNVDIVRALYEKLEAMPFVEANVFVKEKKAKGVELQEVPEGFTRARDLALGAIQGRAAAVAAVASGSGESK